MKPIFITLYLFIAFATTLQAKNYYISAAGNDANDGLTTSTPWKTINKVNSFSFAANDYILFRRGDTFYGGIIVKNANLNYDAYGTGPKPVITGLSTVTGWVNLGGNIWEAPVVNVKSGVNLVLRGGLIQQVGRYPNSDAPNGGYLTYTASTSTSITGPALSSTTNWTGAEVTIRINRWDIIRAPITSHSSGVVSFASIGNTPRLNFGYFFQRDSRTLDKDGEWWHDAAKSKLRMCFSSNDPNLYNIQIATVDTLFKSLQGGLLVSNLSFNGSGKKSIWTNGGSGVTIKNCDVNNSGAEAITTWFTSNVTVDNCTTNNSLGSGIRVYNTGTGTQNLSVTNCNVDSTALIAGMETSNVNNGGAGILCYGGNGLTVQKNTITNCGYVGIHWQGNDVYIKYNYVDRICMVRDDGGGIYTVENGGSTLPVRFNRNIVSNIVLNAIGANNGSDNAKSTSAKGLYFDLGTRNVLIDSNTVANNKGGAFHGNNNSSLTITNNVFYNNGKSYSLQRFADGPLVRNMVIKKNIVYPYRFEYRNLGINVPSLITKEADILAMGLIDSNYYSLRNVDTSLTCVTTNGDLSNYKESAYDVSYLNGTIGVEKHSKNVINNGTFEYNASSAPRVVQFNGLSKKDVFGTVYNNSVSIPAWSSKVLLDNGTTATINKAPLANAGIDKIITLPTDTTTLTGSGTDTDGTISSYEWIQLSGPSSTTITTTNTAVTAISKLIQGVYQYQLTVTDNGGAIAKDTVQVTVNAIDNQTLKADAGTDITLILPINSTVLKGSSTGIITAYSWTKISGPAQFSIATPNNASTAISDLITGTYVFQFKVINNMGDSALAMVKVTASNGVLPVKLIDFTGNKNNDKIVLQWKVASEINVSHYAVERSEDGHSFVNIGQLNASNLLDIQMNYSFNDNLPFDGINYYRLVMIDKNGMFTYSKTISVTVNNALSFRLNSISISSANTNIKMKINSNYEQLLSIVIADVNGRIFFTNSIKLQKGFNVIEKKILTLNTGMYYTKIFTPNQIITKTLLGGN